MTLRSRPSEGEKPDNPAKKTKGKRLDRRRFRGTGSPDEPPRLPRRPTRVKRTPRSRVLDRERQKAAIHQKAVVEPATEKDIREIMEIYDQIYYNREAFVLLSDPAEIKRLETSSDPDDHEKLENARKELSGGGEFAHITEEEWKARLRDPGEQVLVMKHEGKIIGVNSYRRGPEAEAEIANRFVKIDLNDDGSAWEKVAEAEDRLRPAKHMIEINDTFFPPNMQGMSLFVLSYVWMLIYEMSLDEEERVLDPLDFTKWVIYYYVNRFEAIWKKGETPHTPHIADAIKTNNATVVAGLKPPLKAKTIGITPAKKLGGAKPVPSLEGDRTGNVTALVKEKLEPILVLKGYQDLLIFCKNLRSAISKKIESLLQQRGLQMERMDTASITEAAQEDRIGLQMQHMIGQYREKILGKK